MRTRYYRFAGISLAISMPQELFYKNEQRLEPFRIDPEEPDWVFTFEKKDQLSKPEGLLVSTQSGLWYYTDDGYSIRYLGTYSENWLNAGIRMEYRGNTVRAEVKTKQFTGQIPVKFILESLAAEHMIARNRGFVLHCSYIEREGKAILFTAPSETGKSTQAELWNKYRGAEIINGDRASVRLENGILWADGIPFSGSSKYCQNRSLPIEAIVYLGQAPHTTIRKLQGYEAFSKIWEGVSLNIWDKTDMEFVSAVVQKAAAELPIFYLSCTPDESAVFALEEAIRKQGRP